MTGPDDKRLRTLAGAGKGTPSGSAYSAPELKSAIVKRSIELNGHKTSVSLEDEFWLSLRQIAILKNVSLPALLQSIDQAREGTNLSSAIRVYVLNHYRVLAGVDLSDTERAQCQSDRTTARS